MKKLWFAGAVALTLISGAAFAQSGSTDYAGGLSPRDVTGKRLLDANGAAIGHIEKATAQSATVRTPNGKRIEIDMARLALGDGPHTVIETGDSDAEKLNTQYQNGVPK